MAGSRLEKLGTIFTRVNGLIKSGAIKVDDRPIWYDVYRAFPPESEPHFAKPAKSCKVLDVFFPEDVFRAEFQKKARGHLPPIDLNDKQIQNATKIAVDMKKADKSLSVDQVINTLKKNGILITYNTSSITKQVNSNETNHSTKTININELYTNKTETKSISS